MPGGMRAAAIARMLDGYADATADSASAIRYGNAAHVVVREQEQ